MIYGENYIKSICENQDKRLVVQNVMWRKILDILYTYLKLN